MHPGNTPVLDLPEVYSKLGLRYRGPQRQPRELAVVSVYEPSTTAIALQGVSTPIAFYFAGLGSDVCANVRRFHGSRMAITFTTLPLPPGLHLPHDPAVTHVARAFRMEWYDNRGEKLNTLSSPERPFQAAEPGAPLWAGEWGRRERAASPIGMSLRVGEDGAALMMPCASIVIRGRIVPDRSGRFTASGLYHFTGCVVEESAGVPVRVEGRVEGDTLRLTVTRGRDAVQTDVGVGAPGSPTHTTPYDDGPHTFVLTYGLRAVPECELR